MNYKKTPIELLQILSLFIKKNIRYNLFKCEHIFQGKNSNLDVLLKCKSDFNKASKILSDQGFELYLSEKIERFKRMYVKVENNILYAVHLHREVAWHGIKALNKSYIFKREKKVNDFIILPSIEDSLLIHVAHILFENFKVSKEQKRIIKSLLASNPDWNYIDKQLSINHWRKGFYEVIESIKSGRAIKKRVILKSIFFKCVFSLSSGFFVSIKLVKVALRKISFKRRGCMVALIGVNGSGKTTLTRKTLEKYKPISDFFNGQKGYYFGWQPFFFLTKIISKLLNKNNTNVFKKLNVKKQKFSLLKEMILFYNYFDYLLRYLFVVYPRLRKNILVVTDRYFYDTYAQNMYSKQSKGVKLLLRFFPRPDKLFILDANLNDLKSRGKDTKVYSEKVKRSAERKVHSDEYLEFQRKLYNEIAHNYSGIILNTSRPIEENVKIIIDNTWFELVEGD